MLKHHHQNVVDLKPRSKSLGNVAASGRYQQVLSIPDPLERKPRRPSSLSQNRSQIRRMWDWRRRTLIRTWMRTRIRTWRLMVMIIRYSQTIIHSYIIPTDSFYFRKESRMRFVVRINEARTFWPFLRPAQTLLREKNLLDIGAQFASMYHSHPFVFLLIPGILQK